MSNTPVGNEQNMTKVKELMQQKELEKQAEEVNLGDKLENGVLIDFTSGFGNVYQGWVSFKRPNAFEYMRMGATKSEILRRAGVRDMRLVDSSISLLAHIISTLEMVLVKRPEWLADTEDIIDTDILFHVYGKFEEWEDSFRPKVERKDEGDSEPSK